MNLPTLRGSGVAARDVHVRTGTNVAMGADLSGRLARVGIRFVPDDTQPGSQEKRDLQEALGSIRDHLRDHPPLTQSHVAERHLFRDIVAAIQPIISGVSVADVAQLTVLDDVPAPGAGLPGATEIWVSPEFLVRLMALDGAVVAHLETSSIRVVEDGAGATPNPIEDLRAALIGVRGAIGDEGGRVAFNAGVTALNGLTAADTAAFTVALTDIEATPELAVRYRADVEGVIDLHPNFAAGFPDIAHHEHNYLLDRFDAATRKFMMIKWQIELHPGCPEGIKRDLQVCALDFLVHGAMVTMTTGREAMDMKLLEFRGNGVNVDSSYHRAQGKCAVTQLFKELLQENGDYRFLFASKTDSKSVAYDLGAGDRRDACVLVDGPEIMRTLENKYAAVRPPLADDVALGVAVAAAAAAMPAGQMLDLSAYFVGAATRDELARRMDVVRTSIRDNGGMIGNPIFAQFPVAGVTVTVAFDTRAGNPHQRELNTMANFGSRTDIIKIRDAVVMLADLGGLESLEALRPKLPVTTDAVVVNAVGMAADADFTGAMVTAAVTTLRDALTAHVVAPPNPRATLYYGLISQTLDFLQDNMSALPGIPADPINKYIYDTIGRMGDLVVDMVGHEGNAPVFTNTC